MSIKQHIKIKTFTGDGSIDFDSVDSLEEFYIDKRVKGITILGMMGEASKLSSNESEKVIKSKIIPKLLLPRSLYGIIQNKFLV